MASFGVLSACSSSSSSGFTGDSGAASDGGQDVAADTFVSDTGDTDAGADSGDETSGPVVSCDNLCDAVVQYCTSGELQYSNKSNCLAACKGTPAGTLGDNGDTIGCRQQQSYNSHSTPADCDKAGPFGGGTCGDRCASFCRIIVSACAGAPYADVAACKSDCGSKYKFDTGLAEYTTSGNTLNCREGVLRGILDTPDGGTTTACANAGPNSTLCR